MEDLPKDSTATLHFFQGILTCEDPEKPSDCTEPFPNYERDCVGVCSKFSGFAADNDGTCPRCNAKKEPEDLHLEAKERSEALLKNYHLLHEIIIRHELVIQRRWMGAKREKRLQILRGAWPNIPMFHRPDFDAMGQLVNSDDRHVCSELRYHFLCPYINEADLLRTRPLLLLLNARARHHPSDFAAADSEAMQLGKNSGAIYQPHMPGHVMTLNGIQRDEQYGKLIAWADDPKAREWARKRQQFQPWEGLLVLEAQQRVLDFLVRCCQHLLHGQPFDKLTSESYPCQPEPELKDDEDDAGLSSLAALAADGPYKIPFQLDLDRIESLLSAQASAAEDHLLALREDPAYFAEQFAELDKHHQSAGPTWYPEKEIRPWTFTLTVLVLDAYSAVEGMSVLRQEAKELRMLIAKHVPLTGPRIDPPEVVMTPLLRFHQNLVETTYLSMHQMHHSFYSSPPMKKFRPDLSNLEKEKEAGFRSRFTPANEFENPAGERKKKPETNNVKKGQGQKCSRAELYRRSQEGYLFWIMGVLCVDNDLPLGVRLPQMMDELQRLLHTAPDTGKFISAYISGAIGNLSILCQCITQLELYYGFSAGLSFAKWERRDTVLRCAVWNEPFDILCDGLYEATSALAARLGKTSDGKIITLGKRRTRDNTEAVQQAEKNLDRVWAAIDSVISHLEGKAVRELDLHRRQWQRTPNWIERLPPIPKSAPIPAPTDAGGFGLLNRISGNQSAPKIDRTPAKVKVKTKGTPHEFSPLSPDKDDNNDNDATVSGPAPIPVDARALKAFCTLFFDPDVTATPGEVNWTDFLHAMMQAGFTAEKLHGSVWQFQNKDRFDQATINFHEPHPQKKLPFSVARRYGRRLDRAFGWDLDAFTLKKRG